MSITELVQGRPSATAADCVRLWSTLTTEYIPDLQLVILPVIDEDGIPAIRLEVIDISAVTTDGHQWINVWGSKEFRNGLNLISVGSLFDLLIVAYRKIEGYFTLGEPSAPARRRA